MRSRPLRLSPTLRWVYQVLGLWILIGEALLLP
jgi:hypothetical protein